MHSKNVFYEYSKNCDAGFGEVVGPVFNKESILEILDGPPKSKDPFMLEIMD